MTLVAVKVKLWFFFRTTVPDMELLISFSRQAEAVAVLSCLVSSFASGKKKNPGLRLAKEVFAQPTPAAT